jgi:hypothetical protein
MSAKKQVTATDVIFDDTKIILKSTYDKAGIKYFIQPCKDKYGRFPECVRPVNSQGDMIITENQLLREQAGEIHYIPENTFFTITSGQVFDLTDVRQRCEWEAIKNCPLIAPSRFEKDKNGVPVIDGPNFKGQFTGTNGGRSGVAELYIDHPGMETNKRVNRKKLIHDAESYVLNDENGLQGQINMARLLGKNMSNQPAADVLDFLLNVASSQPEKIINLYTGGETSLRLLLIEAKEKHVIYIKNKLYLYGDNIALGATDDAVIAWMKNPNNKKVLELIKKDTFPDLITE